MALLRRARTLTTLDDPIICGTKFLFPPSNDLNNNSYLEKIQNSNIIDHEPIYSESFVWDWPFSADRQALGFLSEDKFCVCLPFTNGGTGESKGTLKKFEKASGLDFIWTLGLCNNGFMGTYFWRIEIQILRDLNMLVLNASKDVARPDETSKRLKRVRKVYRLPSHYDISTLTTETYDWAVVIEVSRRPDKRPRRPLRLQRANTLA